MPESVNSNLRWPVYSQYFHLASLFSVFFTVFANQSVWRILLSLTLNSFVKNWVKNEWLLGTTTFYKRMSWHVECYGSIYRKSQTGDRIQVEDQYVSFTTDFTVKLCNRDQAWVVVEQVSFITGTRSRTLNEIMRRTYIITLTRGLGLCYSLKVPETDIDTIRSKLTMKL